ncbi:MAG: IS481 family transposase [Acidimicrobiales bacterium]
MDKAQFLIETHLRTGKPIAELASAHGVHLSWLYKLLARHRTEGEAGLEPRSRRPHRSPIRIASGWEERIVAMRKELVDLGADAGAETIRYHLTKVHEEVPSVSTIWRVLKARGFVTPQPQKRPKSSWHRFAYEFPNECWQADVTHVVIADGTALEVLNVLDDHSRICVASRAFVTVTAPDVVRSLHKAATTWGYPESLLTDNGLVFTSQVRHGILGHLEMTLMSLGITSKHSRPYHPQTCGKVERFHQTLKKYLAKQEPAPTKKQLQAQLDRFVAYYNKVRPHRAIGRRTPLEAFEAREKSFPRNPPIDCSGYKVRSDKVDTHGSVTLRLNGRLHHIGVGRSYSGWRVVMLVAGLDIQIIGFDGSPLRHLTLDPSVDYQRQP